MAERRDRIAIFLPSLAAGGAEAVMVTLANGFAGRGFGVDMLLASAQGPHLDKLDSSISVIEVGGKGVMAAIPGLARYLRRARPAALLSAMSHTNVAAVLGHLLARTSVRLVISERMSLAARADLYDSPRERFLRRLMRLLYGRASAIVAVSNVIADELRGTFKLSAERIKVLANPLVTDCLIRASKEEPEQPWWPVPGPGPLILAAGRLSAVKNYPLLLEAFAMLRQNRPARLLVLGEGEERAALERKVAELKLSSHVLMPGFVANPFSFMRRADLFVLSSSYEGLPGVLVQAMACGTPVVSTDCRSGPREILEDGRWGRLVPVNDVQALAAAMATTLDQAGPDVAVRAEHYRVDAAVEAYLDVLLPPA